MVSNGPNSQSYNFTHMFDMQDIRGTFPITVANPNSLLDIIRTNPDFSKYNYILKLSRLENLFNNIQANFTVFIPSDKALNQQYDESVFVNMDQNTAIHLIKMSMLNDRINGEILRDCPSAYYMTKDEANRILISNYNYNTYIDNSIRIIKMDVLAINGIIHITDGILSSLFTV